jgi:hypothetical protein
MVSNGDGLSFMVTNFTEAVGEDGGDGKGRVFQADGCNRHAMMPLTVNVSRDTIGATVQVCLFNLRVHRFHTHTHSMDPERHTPETPH